MNDTLDPVRLPSCEEGIAPVTILDAHGHVVRIVAASEFRRVASEPPIPPGHDHRRRRSRGRA